MKLSLLDILEKEAKETVMTKYVKNVLMKNTVVKNMVKRNVVIRYVKYASRNDSMYSIINFWNCNVSV